MTEISAQVSQAQIAFDKASRDFKRVDNLYKDSGIVGTISKFKIAYEIAQQQLASAILITYSRLERQTTG